VWDVKMKTDYVLDTVGKYCPVPVIDAANKLKEMKKGETLTVISDDEEIRNDIRKWCEITGNEFIDEFENDSEIELYIRRADA
jgi:tRNA 2-thiouridine synthesizing protein A